MLILLILAVNIIKLIFMGFAQLKENRKNKTKAQPAVETRSVSNSVEVSDDDEIVVAITAALTAYYDAQEVEYKSNLKFKVRSIKEI